MQTEPVSLLLGPDSSESFPTLPIIVLYADFEAGNAAVHVCRHLASRFGAELNLPIKPWSFGVMGMSRLRRAIESDLAEAAIVVVALKEHEALPSDAARCLEAWAAQVSARPVALVGVLSDGDDPTHGKFPAIKQLQEIATRAQAEFFHTRCVDAPALETVADKVAQRAEAMTSVLARIVQTDPRPPVSHWGINE